MFYVSLPFLHLKIPRRSNQDEISFSASSDQSISHRNVENVTLLSERPSRNHSSKVMTRFTLKRSFSRVRQVCALSFPVISRVFPFYDDPVLAHHSGMAFEGVFAAKRRVTSREILYSYSRLCYPHRNLPREKQSRPSHKCWQALSSFLKLTRRAKNIPNHSGNSIDQPYVLYRPHLFLAREPGRHRPL